MATIMAEMNEEGIGKLTAGDTEIAYRDIEGKGRVAEREAVSKIIPYLFPEITDIPTFLKHNSDGSPFLPGFIGYMSVSHGGGIAIVARNDTVPVGIDIEAPRQQLKRVERKFVGIEDYKGNFPENLPQTGNNEANWPNEANEANWTNKANNEQISRLLALWTAKEAVYKAASLPGLSLTDIHVITPYLAAIPDGRRYSLVRLNLKTGNNLVTIALLRPDHVEQNQY